MKLLGVMIGSEQTDVLGEFYTKVLGAPSYKDDGWYGFGDDNSSLMIGSHSAVKGMSKNPERLMLSFVTEDVKAEFDRIKALGAKVIAEPYQPDAEQTMWLATLADPDGNYLQLSNPWK